MAGAAEGKVVANLFAPAGDWDVPAGFAKNGDTLLKNKKDLKKRLKSALASLQKDTKRIMSFFKLKDTKYAAQEQILNVS
ncbi:hypothetical protein RP726_05300 [Candidatus Methylospira mobilis]|uniref:hypothetical protein n=1 Tax=Candidatus Methylospira mobilis TaxID=1808979 RepID=UPI0028E512B3|nr:hypothetical protein [Candidatus Methylospira mobilis]WNV05835.1 hypothetical protein RP726_05300 [Candidatus Methylospira mobilis]